MGRIHVDRCLCHSVTFAELKAVAEAAGILDRKELQERVVFGTECGLCLPYVAAMLRTGRVVFDYLISPDGEAPDTGKR